MIREPEAISKVKTRETEAHESGINYAHGRVRAMISCHGKQWIRHLNLLISGTSSDLEQPLPALQAIYKRAMLLELMDIRDQASVNARL